jgi:hypothetical protein
VYNNLAYVSLGHFDPPSYFILLQLRVIITGPISSLPACILRRFAAGTLHTLVPYVRSATAVSVGRHSWCFRRWWGPGPHEQV